MASSNKNFFLYNNTKYLEKRKKLFNSNLNINEYGSMEKNINREELNNFNKISNSSNENKLYELIKKLNSTKAVFFIYLKSYEKNGIIKNNDISSESKQANIALLKYIINELNIKDIESIIKLINIIFLILDNYLENTNEILLKKRCNKILNLINKKELKLPKNELKLPKIIIPKNKIEFDDFTNIYQYYSNYGESSKREFAIDITHFYLHNIINNYYPTGSSANFFIGLYYHDSTNKNEKNITQIKNALIKHFEENKKYFEKNLTINNWKEEYDKYNNYIDIINSEIFWNEDRYFKISSIEFLLGSNNIKIETFNGLLLKKGNGHLMLCIFLSLFFYYEKYRSYKINLKAGVTAVADKFYKKIGFDCNEYDFCKANIKKLIDKCIYTSDVKLILQKNNKFTDKLEDLI